MLCALINENKVVDIRELTDSQIQDIGSEYSAIVDITSVIPEPQIGDLFNGFVIVGTVPSVKITKLAFLSRFTDTELATIEGFAATQVNAYGFAVKAALRKQSLATYIDLALPETISGTQALVALGILTAPRCAVILNQTITEKERYKGG